MINAAKIAVQKVSTSSLSLHLATNINIDALTTTRKRPKVKRTAGKVSSFSSDPSVALSKPNNSATHRYVVNPPLTSMPGISAVATQKDNASAAQRTNNFIKKL
jgi:hypothetical protein